MMTVLLLYSIIGVCLGVVVTMLYWMLKDAVSRGDDL